MTTGCLDSFSDAESTSKVPTSTSSPSSTQTRESTTTTHIEQETRTSLPLSAYSFEWTATLKENATDSHLPQVQLSLTNTADGNIYVGFGATPPFSHIMSETAKEEDRLILFHPDMGPQAAPTTQQNECWTISEEGLAIYDVLRPKTLEADETVSETYSIYNGSTNDKCFPAGAYTFSDTIFIGESEAEMAL